MTVTRLSAKTKRWRACCWASDAKPLVQLASLSCRRLHEVPLVRDLYVRLLGFLVAFCEGVGVVARGDDDCADVELVTGVAIDGGIVGGFQ